MSNQLNADGRVIVSLIVACDLNSAIGKNNTIPWRLKTDMRLFKENTLGKTVLMGRKTAESIGRALPGRVNLVMTRGETAPYPGQVVVHNLIDAVALVPDGQELCIIGGAEIYELALSAGIVDIVKMTSVVTVVDDADAFFRPDLIRAYQMTAMVRHSPDEHNEHVFFYYELKRKAVAVLPT